MRVAMIVGGFPSVSETFILRQITGLIDLGHDVDIYAEWPPAIEREIFEGWREDRLPLHPEVRTYGLLDRTTYINSPVAAGYWEQPVWPITGKTWLPGAESSIPNILRVLEATPVFLQSFVSAPKLTLRTLDPRRHGDQARSLSALYRFAKLCRQRRRYDVAHIHFEWREFVGFVGELWDVPVVLSFHGRWDFGDHARSVYEEAFAAAQMVTVNSAHLRKRVDQLGCPPSKVRLLHESLDPRRFRFAERTLEPGEPVRIVTVARLVEVKGHEYAIRAVAKLAERRASVRYDIVGDGPHRELEELIRELGLQEVVTLHGALAGGDVVRMMAKAHLFVLASVATDDGEQEGQGLAIQEAQATGLPVVVTDHGPFAEGIAVGESGFLVPERDVEALAERLAHLVEHPELWPAMGRAGRRHVENRYDSRVLNRRLVELYAEAADAHAS
jgi:colanic acid/amylovoran/stewartan biosynthesis glycosyltransferase WcaL/AmsK/CpsK